MRRRLVIATVLVLLTAGARHAIAQKEAPVAEGASAETSQPEVLDRVVAIVNNSVLLESDLEDEMRFAAFEPFTAAGTGDSRQAAMRRLVDRSLVEQQRKLQPSAPAISDADVDKQLMELRRSLPACARASCTSDTGWKAFCEEHGFTPEQVRERWRTRMALLAFIEQRFRTGIRISEPEIADYYNKQFAPKFADKRLKAPPLAQVSARIQEILLQERVNVLLDQWLSSLRDQGDVQVLDARDVPPQEKDASTDPSATPMPGSAGDAPPAVPPPPQIPGARR